MWILPYCFKEDIQPDCSSGLLRLHWSFWSMKANPISDFPGAPVVKTPCSQCRGHGIRSLFEGKIPYAAWPKRLSPSHSLVTSSSDSPGHSVLRPVSACHTRYFTFCPNVFSGHFLKCIKCAPFSVTCRHDTHSAPSASAALPPAVYKAHHGWTRQYHLSPTVKSPASPQRETLLLQAVVVHFVSLRPWAS